MANIGFVEKTDIDKTNMIKFLVDSAKGINTSKMNKEENLMAKATKQAEEIVEKTDVVVEDVQVAPEADAKADVVETAPEEILAEKAAMPAPAEEETDEEDATETPADEEAEAKKPMAPKSDDVTTDVVPETNDGLEKAFSDLVLTVKSLQAEVEMLKSSKVDVETAKTSFEAVAKDIAAVSSDFNEFGKRVELVEQDTAFRKSGDLGEIVQNQPETVEKSLWGGSFLKTADLFN